MNKVLCYWLVAVSLSLGSWGLVAHADRGEALAQVCGQLIGSQVMQCQAAAGGRHVDPGAAQVCGQLIGSQVIQCVGAIAGKDYNQGEQANCGQLIGSQVIECMRQTGRPHYVAAPPAPWPTPYPPQYPPRRGPLTVAEIRAEVAAALESLRASDQMGADRRLRRLDLTFAALANPTRRAILARLAAGEASVNDLAAPFSMSQPAVSKHLQVLERAGLISSGSDAQRRPRKLEARPLAQANEWLETYRVYWEASFLRLDDLLGELKEKQKKPRSKTARKS